MKRIKRRTYSGVVCEIELYSISGKAKNNKTATPRLRFNTEEEREKHKIGISKRKH